MALGILRRDRTRRRLIEAARRLFARLGYERATVDDVAREAGFSKGAFYFHFASKEDVLLALVDEWAERRLQRLEAAVDGQPPDVALADVLEALLSSEAGNGDAQLLLEFWLGGERNPKVKQRLTKAYRSWRALLAKAFRRAQAAGAFVADGEPEAAADAALALHDGLIVRHRLGPAPGASPRAGTEALVMLAAALRGVRAPTRNGARTRRAAG